MLTYRDIILNFITYQIYTVHNLTFFFQVPSLALGIWTWETEKKDWPVLQSSGIWVSVMSPKGIKAARRTLSSNSASQPAKTPSNFWTNVLCTLGNAATTILARQPQGRKGGVPTVFQVYKITSPHPSLDLHLAPDHYDSFLNTGSPPRFSHSYIQPLEWFHQSANLITSLSCLIFPKAHQCPQIP